MLVEEEEEQDESRPPMNIILFYADDWRHDVRLRVYISLSIQGPLCPANTCSIPQTLGAAGNPIVKTPVLDKLAAEGVRFTENCVTTSICWISRATLYR